MGFVTEISGKILMRHPSKDLIGSKLICQSLMDKLPLYKNDEFPYLPREAFSLTFPELEGLATNKGSHAITYKYFTIHFGYSIKSLDEHLGELLNKFEAFIELSEYIVKAEIQIKIEPYLESLLYTWNSQSSGEKLIMTGDSKDFGTLLKEKYEK